MTNENRVGKVHSKLSDKMMIIAVCVFALFAGLGIAIISYKPIHPPFDPAERVEAPSTATLGLGTEATNITAPTATEFLLTQFEPISTPSPSQRVGTLPSSTLSLEALRRWTPPATHVPTSTPVITWSGYVELCDPEIFSGIRHCTLGPYEILRINPKDAEVRFETVLPMGFDRYGNYGECRDVHVPDTIDPLGSPGPGCHVGNGYPGERLAHMASRYPGAVAAFNGDFFSPTYDHGPTGLTVKNGERLDGYYDDQNIRDVMRSSVSISSEGYIRMGLVDRYALPDPEQPWAWIPDPEKYYNTIGGLPLLVKDGYPLDLHNRCILEEGWCPDETIPRARTAFGRTYSGEAIVLVAPEEWGVTLETLSYLMVELGASEAINLDGGGSSQMWFDGNYLVYSSRPIAEGMLVFSDHVHEVVEGRLSSKIHTP